MTHKPTVAVFDWPEILLCSLACLQELATGPYPEPDGSTLHPHIMFCKNPSEYYLTISAHVSQWSLSFRYSNKNVYKLLISPNTLTSCKEKCKLCQPHANLYPLSPFQNLVFMQRNHYK